MKLYVNKPNETFRLHGKSTQCTKQRTRKIIAAAREVSATAGIYITKKRYAILVYDNEGHREDKDDKPPGKIKAMGPIQKVRHASIYARLLE